jgi:ABC-2 type transport system ATP-binding protein
MRGSSVLRFFAEMHPGGNLDRSRLTANRLELDTRRHVAFMSTGMRQKLALAVVLSLDTPLLILDEPTANLDPTIRAIVLDLVIEARRAGRTVIFSSHVLGEIEQTCDRVAFLRHGRLARELTISELFQRHRVTAISARRNIEVPEQWQSRVSIRTEPQGDRFAHHLDTAGDLADLLPWIDSLKLSQIRIEPLGLRAVYDAVHFGTDAARLEDEA